MEIIPKRVFNLLIYLAIATAMSYMSTVKSWAQDESFCFIEATKLAPGAGSQEFLFTGFAEEEPIPPFTLVDGESTGGPIPEGVTVVITEEHQEGWIFGGIECEGGDGLVVTNNDNGFTLECVDSQIGNKTCVIRNVRAVNAIPTISEWGLIVTAGGFGLIGLFYAIKRKRIAA